MSWSPPESDKVVGWVPPSTDKVVSDKDPHHLWSPGEDIGRAFVEGVTAVGEDLDPSPITAIQQQAVPLGAAGKLVGDIASVPLAPLTGAVRSTVGSAASYLQPGNPEKEEYMRGLARGTIVPGTPIPEGHQTTESERKARGDTFADIAGSALTPELLGFKPLTAEQKLARLQNRAINKVAERAKLDQLSAQEIMNQQAAAKAAGDVALPLQMGKTLTRQAKDIYQKGGELATGLEKFLKRTWNASGDYLKSQIQEIKSGSTYDTQQELFEQRSAAAAPLYEEAGNSHSIAPLKQQISAQFEKTIAARHEAEKNLRESETYLQGLERELTHPQPGYNPPTAAEMQNARARVQHFERELNIAEQNKYSTQKMLAQAEKEENLPGAVWSPRLQAFMSDPIVQSGMKTGLRIEKRFALAEGRPFIDKDYAITGWDEHGDPIIAQVPTMKAWMGANEGLKEAAMNMVHGEGPNLGRPTKEGVATRKLQRAVEAELREIRDVYGKAVDTWAGGTSALDALNQGKNFFRDNVTSLPEWKAEFAAMSPSEKEFFKLGASEEKVKQLTSVRGKPEQVGEDVVNLGNFASTAIKNKIDIEKYSMLFGDPEKAQKFFESVARKQQLQDATKAVLSGLNKDPEEIEAEEIGKTLRDVGHMAAAGATHHTFRLLSSGWDKLQKIISRNNPKVNAEIIKILTNPEISGLDKNPAIGKKDLTYLPLGSFGASDLNQLLNKAKGDGQDSNNRAN